MKFVCVFVCNVIGRLVNVPWFVCKDLWEVLHYEVALRSVCMHASTLVNAIKFNGFYMQRGLLKSFRK